MYPAKIFQLSETEAWEILLLRGFGTLTIAVAGDFQVSPFSALLRNKR